MKHLYAWIAVGSLLLGSTACFAATSTTASAVAKVNVDSVFELTLDRTDIDFGNMRPGTTRFDIPASGIKVTTRSNTGQKWFLKVSSTGNLNSGLDQVSNSNLYWYGWTNGQGSWLGTGNDAIQELPVSAYESTDSEGLNIPDGTDNYFKFKLSIPASQRAGLYETVVKFTLTQ
jgi:hypothetical protein